MTKAYFRISVITKVFYDEISGVIVVYQHNVRHANSSSCFLHFMKKCCALQLKVRACNVLDCKLPLSN